MSVVSGPEMECCQNLKQRLVQALQQLSLQTFVFGEFVHISGTLAFSIDGKQDYQVIVSEMTHPETRLPADEDGFSANDVKTEVKTEMDAKETTLRRRRRISKPKKTIEYKVIDSEDTEEFEENDNDKEDEDYLPDQAVDLGYQMSKFEDADDDDAEINVEDDDDDDDTAPADDGDDYDEDGGFNSRKKMKARRITPQRKTKNQKLHTCPEPDCAYETSHTGHFDYHMRKHRGARDHKCDECDKEFFALDELKRHKCRVHSRNWHCNKCSKTFKVKKELREHLRKEHEFVVPGKLTGTNCTACEAKFVSNADLKKHINEVHNHICSVCGESFPQPAQLKKHTMSSHRDSILTCPECGKKCGSRGALKKHIHRHREKEKGGFPCDICGKMFTSQGSMYHHKKGLHSGIKPYECKECDAKFSFNHSLKLHTLKHKGIRPYPCPQCDKTYLTNNHLKMHTQAVHGTEKKYKCPICNKGFPYDNSLKMHMMLHTDNKPFMCCICSKSFVSKSALKVHEATHVEGKNFECDVCHKMYKTEMLLRAHRRRHTEDGSRFMCDICGSVFMYRSNLDAHYTVHGNSRNFECKVCHKTFKTYATLYSHQQVHRKDSPFVCHCGKAFKSKERLKAHEVRHSGLKPHTCVICNNAFPDKGGLSKHLKTVHAKSPRFGCPACKKTCNRADNLRVHMKVHNDPELFKLSLKELCISSEYDENNDEGGVSNATSFNTSNDAQLSQQQGTAEQPLPKQQDFSNSPATSAMNHSLQDEQGPLVIDDRCMAVPLHNNMQRATHEMPNSHLVAEAHETSTPGLIDLSMSTPSNIQSQQQHHHHQQQQQQQQGHSEGHPPINVAPAQAHFAQLATGPVYYPSPLFNVNTLLPAVQHESGVQHYHPPQ